MTTITRRTLPTYTFTEADLDKIKLAIKAQKWDKYSYFYACHGMDHYGYMWVESYKKAEWIEIFFKLLPEKFHLIKDFTTFKHLSFVPSSK